jgi:DNA-nicking Smr family endonuclease
VRSLSADEEALWAQVAATIRPLSREPLKTLERPEQPGPARSTRSAVDRPAPRTAEPVKSPPKPGTLDSNWDKRLRAGTVEPDRVLDLHGLNLDKAWAAIDRGLEAAIKSGERVLLLITGHARPGDPPVHRGKIRAAVHDWLAVSRHAPRIAAVRGAHRRHGGGGSLYIILRRNRSGSTFS